MLTLEAQWAAPYHAAFNNELHKSKEWKLDPGCWRLNLEEAQGSCKTLQGPTMALLRLFTTPEELLGLSIEKTFESLT